MGKVLTIADARKYAESKKFHLPVVYEEAVKALKNTRTINEANEFNNAAEALATWAKIYRSDEAGRQAKQLKLHAYRRMGELARQLAPGKPKKGGGRHPGPAAKLQELGFSHHQANGATYLSKLNKRDFNKLVNQKNPPAPTSAAKRFRVLGTTTQWQLIRASQHTPFNCTVFISENDPVELARKLNKGEVKLAREMTIELIEWLDEFEQALPK